MIVTEQEYQEMYKEFNGNIFTPKANLIVEEVEVDGEKEKIFKYEILKTADEVYQDYLNPTVPVQQINQQDSINSQLLKANANTQMQLSAQQKLNADILLKLANLGGSTNV